MVSQRCKIKIRIKIKGKVHISCLFRDFGLSLHHVCFLCLGFIRNNRAHLFPPTDKLFKKKKKKIGTIIDVLFNPFTMQPRVVENTGFSFVDSPIRIPVPLRLICGK